MATNEAMQGKVCLITGANSGIGYEAALALAGMGATVVLHARDDSKGQAAQANIKQQTGNDAVDLLIADFASLQAVRDMAAEFLRRYDRLDVLLNNAGAAIGKRKLSVEGFELTFASNHLAPFLLTNLLLDVLKQSAPARVVTVSSTAHKAASLNFDDLQATRRYNSGLVYSRSKLANLLFSYELARQTVGSGVTANALHPGGVASNFAMSGAGMAGFFMKAIRPFLITPQQGAQTSIYLASSPEVADITGLYFDSCKPTGSSKYSYDQAAQRRLWQVSAEMVGITAG